MMIYASNIQDTQARGKDSGSQIKLKTPVMNPKNIVMGISVSTNIFAGNATSDRRPILLSINGNTNI